MDNRIKERRKALKLTQSELGKMIGVTKATVSLWENETNTPNGANLQALASILRCSPEWILTGKSDLSIRTPIPKHIEKAKIPLIEKKYIATLCNGEVPPQKQANAEVATALGGGPRTFAYIETSEGMMHRITPKDTVYIDPDGKVEPDSVGIFLFKVGSGFQLGTLKSTPGGLMLQFDSNEPGWDSIRVNEDDYIGRLVAYIPHWLGQ
jgi:DNA-binding XRE family transcriptional regulator